MKVLGVFKAANEARVLPAGSVIFEAGDEGEGEGEGEGEEMFGIIEGTVELRMPDGRVFELSPDDCFGEMAVVDKSPRSGTAVATADTTLAVIDRRRFLFLIGETPTFALQVMSSLAERLRHAHH